MSVSLQEVLESAGYDIKHHSDMCSDIGVLLAKIKKSRESRKKLDKDLCDLEQSIEQEKNQLYKKIMCDKEIKNGRVVAARAIDQEKKKDE